MAANVATHPESTRPPGTPILVLDGDNWAEVERRTSGTCKYLWLWSIPDLVARCSSACGVSSGCIAPYAIEKARVCPGFGWLRRRGGAPPWLMQRGVETILGTVLYELIPAQGINNRRMP